MVAAVYGLSTWALTVATGPGHVVEQAQRHGTELVFFLAGQRLPETVVLGGYVLFVTSLFAGLLAWHNVAARYHFSLGRQGLLPNWLGRTSPRGGASVAGSLAQSGFGLAVLAVNVAGGWDPTRYLFFTGSTYGGLGVLVLLILTAAAVVVFFLRRRQYGWRYTVAPVVALLCLGAVLVFTVDTFGETIGVTPDNPAGWLLPASYAAVFAAGAAWAALPGRRRGVTARETVASGT